MVEGVVVVVEDAGRFLLIQRAAHILAGGAWCFVGGAIEPDESQREAVVREFAEEVGGRVQPVEKIWETVRAGRLRLHWWRAALLEPVLVANPAEVQQIRWCAPDEMLALDDLLETNREFLYAWQAGRISRGDPRAEPHH